MGKFCSNCGNELKEADLFCDNCGKQIEKTIKATDEMSDKNVQTTAEKEKQLSYAKPKKKGGCLKYFIIVFVIIGGIGLIMQMFIKTNADLIADATNMSEKEALAVSGILDKCKIGELNSITYDENLDIPDAEGEKGYRMKNALSSNIILYINPDNSVNTIRWADKDFYKNDTQLLSFEDFMITDKEKSDYQISAMESVKNVLKSPSTAKFPNILEWNIWKEDGIYFMQSYVDSQNGFGAMVRSEFQIKVKDNQIISFILDGEELIK